MKRKLILIIFLFFVLFSLFNISILAKDGQKSRWAISYINNSSLILSTSISLIFSFTGMIEMNLGQFYFGQIPFNYCLGFISALFIENSAFSLAFSPILTLHLGLSSIALEFIEGIGLGVGFEASKDIKPYIGFTAIFQLNYYLDKYNGIFFQISTISGYMNYGIGIFVNLTGGKK
ncbi:MAG: hypothetical protein ACK4YF_04230 [Exilispira sp.]